MTRLTSAVRTPILAMCAAMAIASVGCSSETGLRLEINRVDGDQTTAAIDELTVHVGYQLEFDSGRFHDAPGFDVQVVDLAGRELSTEPYSITVTPRDLGEPSFAGAGVRAMALASAQGQVVAAAWLEDPVIFEDGEVLSYTLSLVGNAPEDDGSGCVSITNGPTLVNIADMDCDGYENESSGGDDCDDTRSRINPGATEICDGYDDDCNPDTTVQQTTCFASADGQCSGGVSACDDTNPDGAMGTCVPNGAAPVYYCEAYQGCLDLNDGSDVEDCTIAAVEDAATQLTVNKYLPGEVYEYCDTEIALGDDCGNEWEGVQIGGSGDGLYFLDCPARLEIVGVPILYESYVVEVRKLGFGPKGGPLVFRFEILAGNAGCAL